MSTADQPKIPAAFEDAMIEVPLERIITLKQLPDVVRASRKYQIIVTTVRETGLVEAPVVARCRDGSGNFLLLDGHARIDVLKAGGANRITCLVATDDEAFTYNKRNSPVATVQEHKMILKAVEQGVPEQQIAMLLKVDISTIRRKVHLLDGIAPEVAEMLKDKRCPVSSFRTLSKMKPVRQLAVASMMVSMNTYSSSFARTMLDATKPSDLVDPAKPKPKGLLPEQVEQMQTEMASLQDSIKEAEISYGADSLKLVLATGYVSALLKNGLVSRFLSLRHKEIFAEFQRITDLGKTG